MTGSKTFIATVVSVPAANAQVNVNVIGAGSSAMWQIFALAAFNNLAGRHSLPQTGTAVNSVVGDQF